MTVVVKFLKSPSCWRCFIICTSIRSLSSSVGALFISLVANEFVSRLHTLDLSYSIFLSLVLLPHYRAEADADEGRIAGHARQRMIIYLLRCCAISNSLPKTAIWALCAPIESKVFCIGGSVYGLGAFYKSRT